MASQSRKRAAPEEDHSATNAHTTKESAATTTDQTKKKTRKANKTEFLDLNIPYSRGSTSRHNVVNILCTAAECTYNEKCIMVSIYRFKLYSLIQSGILQSP
eukprot:gb/GECG01004180.1/.p1 GENE.gb/GECG01004180.1/~~gb/GECG01004180.1/.p1  ORF type:complete len:102 (+),score=9.47 gb/GECG01004180.1/:1-306(+)